MSVDMISFKAISLYKELERKVPLSFIRELVKRDGTIKARSVDNYWWFECFEREFIQLEKALANLETAKIIPFKRKLKDDGN